jgi:hypothetical protein
MGIAIDSQITPTMQQAKCLHHNRMTIGHRCFGALKTEAARCCLTERWHATGKKIPHAHQSKKSATNVAVAR